MIAALISLMLSGGSTHGMQSLRVGFVIAFLATSLVAVWEIYSGLHLSELFDHPTLFVPRVLMSTFYNPNNYAFFLLSCLGPIMVGAISSTTKKARTFHYAMAVFCTVLVIMTNSRAGAVGCAVIAILAVVWLGRISAERMLLQVASLVVVVVTSILVYWILNPGADLMNLAGAAFSKSSNSASDNLRWDLSTLGFKYFLGSAMLGTGAGSFVAVLSSDTNANVLMDTNAHNTFIELMSQYGVIFAIPFFALLISLVIHGLHGGSMAASVAEIMTLRIQILFALVAVVLGGLAASSLFAEPTWWLLIAYASGLAWQLSRASCDNKSAIGTETKQNNSKYRARRTAEL